MPQFALGIWPIITIILFRSLGPSQGLIWSVTIGYLFLPEVFSIDVPGLPSVNKASVIAFSILLAMAVSWEEIAKMPRPLIANRLFRLVLIGLLVVLFVSPVATILTNRDTLVDGPAYFGAIRWRPELGPVIRQGLRPYDIVSITFNSLVMLIPFMVAMRLLWKPEHHVELLKAVVIVGLFYSLLAVFESRMSPQLNIWIYGYFPHEWVQHVRGGSFRPVVFLRHGLWLGIFLFALAIAAFVLSRHVKGEWRVLCVLTGCWTLAVLLLSHNLGATMLAIVFTPVVLFLSCKQQVRIAALIAIVFLIYPAVKQAEVLPLDRFIAFAGEISTYRAQSLQTRFTNEAAILDRAAERPVFGWGGWGRSRIIDEFGIDRTIADGLWIITLGQWGWVGYIAFFGVLTLPMLYLGLLWGRRPLNPATAGMTVLMAGNLIYLVPNSALSPIGMLMFGSLAGLVQVTTRPGKHVRTAAALRNLAPYSRFSNGTLSMTKRRHAVQDGSAFKR